jgi:hypothetical protein
MAISLSTLTIMIFFKIILCTYDIKKGGDYKRRDTPGRTIQHTSGILETILKTKAT